LGEQKGSWIEKKGVGGEEMKDYTTKKISRCKRHKKKKHTKNLERVVEPSLETRRKKDDKL